MRLRQMFMDEQADQERKLHGHNYDLTMTSEQRALTLLVVGGGGHQNLQKSLFVVD